MSTLRDAFVQRGLALERLPSGGDVAIRFTDTVREHVATRRSAGLFDFSFMAWWEVGGPDALRFLDRLQTRNAGRLREGDIIYTLLCRDDGSVFIDATLWRLDRSRFWLFTGRRSDIEWLANAAAGFDVTLTPRADRYAVLALQGPASARILERWLPGCVAQLQYFRFRFLDREEMCIARLGYTGELGYELLTPAATAATIWRALLDAGRADGVEECGFSAADSLRIEAGYILFANELSTSAWPDELGLGRLVEANRRGFIGGEALRRRQEPRRRLVGVVIDPRSPPWVPAGSRRVTVTSESWSPTFGRSLGLALAVTEANHGSVAYTNDHRRVTLKRLPFRDPARSLVRQQIPIAS